MSGSAAEVDVFTSTVELFGPRPHPSDRTILVGVDGSDTAMRAAAFAFGLARRHGGRLVVTFVACHSPLTAMVPAEASAVEYEAIVEMYFELRDRIRGAAEELGVPVTFLRSYGAPYNTLRDVADDCHADTVVVGASRKAGHRIAGSVSSKLVRAGRWPVLVVP